MAGRRARPLEYSLLYTATLCMLAAGAVMVYSASSAESLLGGSGDPLYYLKRYVAFGLVGFAVMELMRRRGLRVVRSLTGPLLGMSFFLTLAVMVAVAAPYRRARLTSFVDPFADARGSGFQTVQSLVAVGSGGLFGVGLGESVQKIFYLPEAHTDMILAVIAEELGLVGVASVAFLYGMVAYPGLRTAKRAAERYPKLL